MEKKKKNSHFGSRCWRSVKIFCFSVLYHYHQYKVSFKFLNLEKLTKFIWINKTSLYELCHDIVCQLVPSRSRKKLKEIADFSPVTLLAVLSHRKAQERVITHAALEPEGNKSNVFPLVMHFSLPWVSYSACSLGHCGLKNWNRKNRTETFVVPVKKGTWHHFIHHEIIHVIDWYV